jgi:hypothetical protein
VEEQMGVEHAQRAVTRLHRCQQAAEGEERWCKCKMEQSQH